MIAMARALGLKVIAEGVETEEQLAILREEGCDLFQGFLRSGPITAEAFAALAAL
jgi:EAL domain-containing protein (putative c-di-GMP-specific phosphodiesterase class I)